MKKREASLSNFGYPEAAMDHASTLLHIILPAYTNGFLKEIKKQMFV